MLSRAYEFDTAEPFALEDVVNVAPVVKVNEGKATLPNCVSLFLCVFFCVGWWRHHGEVLLGVFETRGSVVREKYRGILILKMFDFGYPWRRADCCLC